MNRTLIVILASLILVGCGGKEEFISCYSTKKIISDILFSINDTTKKVTLVNRYKNIKIKTYNSAEISFTSTSEVLQNDRKSFNPKKYFTENYTLNRITGELTFYMDDSYDADKPIKIPDYSSFRCNKVVNKI
jgi:uncharacterized protein YcfL